MSDVAAPAPLTAIVVLAAGEGARFGDAKQLAVLDAPPLGRAPLLAHALDAARRSGVGPVLCVLGARADRIRAIVPDEVEVVLNERWHEGLSASLRRAVRVLADRAPLDALLVGLGDQPLQSPEAYRRVHAAHADLGADPTSAVIATFGGRRGHPVLLPRALWAEVAELRGDVGARDLLRRHHVVEVPCDDLGDAADVDTPTDLASLVARVGTLDPGTGLGPARP